MFNILLAIVVSASIDSTMLMIGDQTDMHLSVTHEPSEQVAWPSFGAQLQDGIEIVDRTTPDTTTLPDGRIQIKQDLKLTCFKDSLFSISPIAIASGGDTFWTDPMALNVIQPFEMDTTLAITDIKDIEKAPIYWWGIIRWLLIVLVSCGLIWLAFWLYRKYDTYREREQEEPVDPELLRPADEVALEKLDEIKAQKIWRDGKVKEYHTELTDVVREYISRRFGVQSTEKTSDETLRELKPLLNPSPGCSTDSPRQSDRAELFTRSREGEKRMFEGSTEEGKALYERLKTMLRTADLVKFAKWHTTPDENEAALTTAYDFVRGTKEVPSDQVPSTKEEEL